MKYLKFLLVFILLLLPAVGASAEFSTITLKLDGKALKTDVAPVIENDRTLVPVRVISEASGAKVEWDAVSRVVKIIAKKLEIELEIDSTNAVVDGVDVSLDVPAKIISDRTMVPVRFVAENFGYKVEWDGKTGTVSLTSPEPSTDASSSKANLVTVGTADTDKGYRVTVKFDKSIKNSYTMFELENPQRLIIDFKNAQVDFTRQFDFENETVLDARAGNHDEYMRLVIDLKESAEYKSYLSDNEDALVLYFDVETSTPNTPQEPETDVADVPQRLDEVVIVIDAGHGGSDPGALGKEEGETVARESEVNLAVALYTQELLEDLGVKVVMTRDGDDRISLGDRCVVSNNAKAHLFVSIHSNAMDAGGEHINGTMVFYGNAKDKDNPWMLSSKLASGILENLCDAIDTKNLGIQNGDQLAVIRGTEAPAVLVELAFITNEQDREKLVSEKYQRKAAQGIVDGIVQSLGLK